MAADWSLGLRPVLASHRQRLELSSNEFGLILGVAGQSVLNWESGKTKPRAAQMHAIAAFRTMGKREAQARLAKATEAT
jgi:DNA-binding transcriptional regulator YiaG